MIDNKKLLDNIKRKRCFEHLLQLLILGVIVVLHLIFILHFFSPAICTPDANGYWAQGSLLFSTGHTWFKPESDLQYIENHWFATDNGYYFSQYPPGLPILVGSIYKIFGYRASILVNLMLATLSLIGFYLLAKDFLGPWWAIAGVFVLAVNPIFNQQSLWCFAHMAVLFCLVWGLFFIMRWSEKGKHREIFIAGLFFGCIPAVRYPEVLFILGVVIFLIWHLHSYRRIWVHYIAMIVGVVIPLLPLLIHNQLAFGAFYRTAYSFTCEQTAFSWSNFRTHFALYIRGLNGNGVGLFFPLGVIGITMMCCIKEYRRKGILFLILTIPLTFLYIAYYWTPEKGIAPMRFLLPTFIFYIIAGLWFLDYTFSKSPTFLGLWVIAVVLIVQFFWGGSEKISEFRQLHFQKEVLVCITDALERNVGYGAVVIAEPQVEQHLDFVRHWKLADLRYIKSDRQWERMMKQGQDIKGPMLSQIRRYKKWEEEYGKLIPQEREHKIAKNILLWAGEQGIYYVGPKKVLEDMEGRLLNRDSFKIIANISIPEPPPFSEHDRSHQNAMLPPLRGKGFIPRAMGRMKPFQESNELVIAKWTAEMSDIQNTP